MGDRDTRFSLFSGRNGRMLLVGAIGWGTIQSGRRFLPPLLPAIIADFEISPVQAGAILSVMYVTYAIGQYPSGQLSDELSRGTLIAPGLAVLICGYALVAASPTYLVLVAATGLLGLGRAAYSVPIRVLISERFTDRRGRALSIIASFSDIGGVVAATAAVYILATTTWRLPFYVVAIALLGVLLAFLYWYDGGYTVTGASLDVRANTMRVLANEKIRLFLVAYLLFRFTVAGVIDFLPLFLTATKGFSTTAASAGFALIYLMGFLGKPVAGALSDHVQRTVVAGGSLVTSVVALVVLVASGSLLPIVAAISLYGLGYKTVFPVMDAFFLENGADEGIGADLGVIRSLGTAVAAVGPIYVGVVAQTFDYVVAFTGLAVALLFGTVVHVVAAR